MKQLAFVIILLFSFHVAGAQTPTRLRLKQLELAPDTAYVVYSKDDGTAIWKTFSSVLSAGGGVTGPLTAGRIPRATGTYTLSDGVLRDDGTLLALGGATVSGYSFYDYSTGAWRLATGTTAQRPGSPTAGAMRYNTSNGTWEYYGASAWEVPVKSSTTTGLFTAGSVLFADANGRAAQDNSNFFFNDANNSLGVGTASPNSAARFHAYSNSNTASGIRIEQATSGSVAEAFLALYNNTGYGAVELFSSGFNPSGLRNSLLFTTDATQTNGLGFATLTTAPINFRTNSVTPAGLQNTRLTIAGGGNIGIAQASPSYILDINSTNAIRFPVGTTAQRPTGAAGITRYNSTLGAFEGYTSAWGAFPTGSGTNNYITKWTGTYTQGNSALTDDGTTLDYIVSSASDLLFRIWNTGSGTSKIRFVGSDNKAAKHQWTHTSGWTAAIDVSNNTANENNAYMRFAVRGASDTNTEVGMTAATKMTILGSGNVGIGNTAPARTLHVGGEVRFEDLTTDPPTRIIGADADGDLGAITVGSGLSLSAGTLTATATGTMSSFTIAGDAGTPQTISDGNTLDVEGGFGINTTASATDKVVVEVDTTQIATQSDLASVTTLYTGDGTIATDRTVTIDDNYALITSGSPGVLSFTGTSGYVSSLSAYGYAYEIADTAFYITNATVKQPGSGSTIWYIQAGRQDATTLAVAEVNGDGGVTLGSIKTAGESSIILDGQSITHTADLSHIVKIGATTIHATTSTGLGINDTSPEKSLDVGGMGKFRQISGQDNSVTIGTNANMGTGRSASVTGSQSSDVAGRFSFTTGTGLTAGEWVTLTWATAFDNPPAVQLFPEDGDGASLAGLIYVVPTTTGVSIGVNTNSASYESKTYEFNYIVIQGK